MKWKTSLWLKALAQVSSAERKLQASSQDLHMTKCWGKIFRSLQSPPAPAILSRNSGKINVYERHLRPLTSLGTPATDIPEDARTHQKCSAAAQGSRLGSSLRGNCWAWRKCVKCVLQPKPYSSLSQHHFSQTLLV